MNLNTINEDEINLILECLDYHEILFVSNVLNQTQQQLVKNPEKQGDIVVDALKGYKDTIREEKRRITELKLKLYRLKDKLMEGKSELTFDDIIGEEE
jgi:hypothetical protein